MQKVHFRLTRVSQNGRCFLDIINQQSLCNAPSTEKPLKAEMKNECSTTPGTITKISNDLKWPILGKLLKVYHLHVVQGAIRYAKKKSPQGSPPLGGALSPQGSPPLGGALSPQGSPPLGGALSPQG